MQVRIHRIRESEECGDRILKSAVERVRYRDSFRHSVDEEVTIMTVMRYVVQYATRLRRALCHISRHDRIVAPGKHQST